jgi:hypothetical protein
MSGAGFIGNWADLGVSHRMPRPLIGWAREYARMYLPQSERLLPEEPDQLELPLESCELMWLQVEPSELVGATADAFQLALAKVMSRPVVHALAPSQLVLLVDANRRGREIVAELRAREIEVVHTFAGGRKGRSAKKSFSLEGDLPRATTPHSFKGWEAPAIVVCIANGAKASALASLYSALTRVTKVEGGSLLTVVCSEARLAQFGRRFGATEDEPT